MSRSTAYTAGIDSDTTATGPTDAPVSRTRRRGFSGRRGLLAGLLLLASLQVGCIIPIYDANPDVRTRQLIYVSESLRHIPRIWERIWFLDMPDTATPYRTHGGII